MFPEEPAKGDGSSRSSADSRVEKPGRVRSKRPRTSFERVILCDRLCGVASGRKKRRPAWLHYGPEVALSGRRTVTRSPAGALIKLESSFSTLSIRAWPTRKFSVHRGLRIAILFRDIRENILVIRETFTLFSIRKMFRDWG